MSRTLPGFLALCGDRSASKERAMHAKVTARLGVGHGQYVEC